MNLPSFYIRHVLHFTLLRYNTACNKEKGHAQVALSYTLGDAYTLDYWMEMAKKVEDMGADSLCIKDMAGLLVPTKATELIQALKSATNLP